MTRRAAGVSLVATALAVFASAAPALAGVHVTSIETSAYPELRVTVVAPPGSARPSLSENGRRVVGAQAANLGRAKSVVLAVDRSQSMEGVALTDAADAARAFAAAKGAADRIAVIAFGRNALSLTTFSSASSDADAALQRLTPDANSGTALYDAVVLAARKLALESRPGHVILVVTDGRDVSSAATLADAVAAANRAHASVYTIGIAGHDFTPEPLRELAARTGGSFHEAASTSALAALYAQINDQLARTWELRYPTTARPGDTIRVVASVRSVGSGSSETRLVGDAGSSTSTPPTLLPRATWRAGTTALAFAAAVGLLVLLAVGFVFAARSGTWLRARLAPHIGPLAIDGKLRSRPRSRSVRFRGMFASSERAFSNVRQFRALQRVLQRAGLPLLAAELLYICLGAGVLAGLVGAVVSRSPVGALAFMPLGACAPLVFVAFKAQARARAFDNQLPDLLITIAASLKAGHSFRQAIQAVVEEGAEPAADEFRLILTETRLGRPMDDALSDMAVRVGSKNLSFVLTAVTIQRQIGGSLAGLFDMVAETVRQRQQFARKIKGLTAMGRMSAYVLTGLPFVMALGATAMNPAYMAPLYQTSTGHMLIVGALVLMGIGTVLLRRIVAFKG